MEKTTEKIPTWSLCYLVNGDASGLTDEELQTIDRWYKDMGVQVVSPWKIQCALTPCAKSKLTPENILFLTPKVS